MTPTIDVIAAARPAGEALEERLRRGGFAVDESALEQRRLEGAIASLLRRMADPALADRDLEQVTRAIGDLLALAEDLRRVRARAAARRSGEARRWRARLAVD